VSRELEQEQASDAGARGRWGAFSYPLFRRYWLAAVARVFGLQFRFIGMGWFVVSSDGLDLSPIWLGYVGLATSLPTILLSVPFGILADRHEHKTILLSSFSATSVLTFLLAAGIVMERVTIELLLVWALVTGTLAAVATPAISAIMPRLIDRRAMASAVALTSSVWNTMRIVGPALAGVLIAAIGIGQAFFVAAGGMALATALLASLRVAPMDRTPQQPGSGGMWEGVRFILAHQVFWGVIGLSFFTSIFGMSYQTLLPVFADEILDVGAQGFGWMEAATGLGGFLGTLAIIKLGQTRHAGPTMIGSAALFGLLLAAFSTSRELSWSMTLLFAAAFASSMYLNIGMTTLQLLVPDELRGRVMGIWSMTWFLSALGGLPASALAEWIGAPFTVALGALAVSGFAGLLFILASELRQLTLAEEAAAP
jgi:MFS family permease